MAARTVEAVARARQIQRTVGVNRAELSASKVAQSMISGIPAKRKNQLTPNHKLMKRERERTGPETARASAKDNSIIPL
ncbi:hypothetical protein HY477_01070 [Candidatus Uhrbacteria bacterium]|nr:hypothetical protein [Candidatus Uhrbacteria bacterium]